MPDELLREMIQDVYESHRAFRSRFDSRPGEGGSSPESDDVKASRDKFWEALNRLVSKLDPLREAFESDRAAHADAVIDFLEVDIPAFRCGYEKEKYLRKLKSVALNDDQRTRLKLAALGLATRGNFRREFRTWSRLMIVLADEEFVGSLRKAIQPLDYGRAQYGEKMLKTILEHRPDLRNDA